MYGEWGIFRDAGVRLERQGVGCDSGEVLLAEPGHCRHDGPGRRVAVTQVVTTSQDDLDLAGADQDDVAGLDSHAAKLCRLVEIVRRDPVTRLETVDALGPGYVEQYAVSGERADLVDAALVRAAIVDDVRRHAVPHAAGVGDVGE